MTHVSTEVVELQSKAEKHQILSAAQQELKISEKDINAMANTRENEIKEGEFGFEFSSNYVALGRFIFEVTLFILTALMVFWVIAFPSAIGLTITHRYSGTHLDLATYSDRPYHDTPLWWNNYFRQEFGVYWIAFISIHVFCAWMAFPTYAIQLFRPSKGDKCHKVFGMVVLLIITVLWVCGGTAAGILVMMRGFNPCAYMVVGQQDTRGTSFPYYLFLQFGYDGAVLNECIMHGMAARVLIGVRIRNIVKMWHICALGFLSCASLYLYVCRTGTQIGLLIAHYAGAELCLDELHSPYAPNVSNLWIMAFVFLLQFFLIPLVNISNLRFTKALFDNFGKEFEVPDAVWKYHHGSALTIAGFVVLWTFIANVSFLIWVSLASIMYVVMLIILAIYWIMVVRKSSNHDAYIAWVKKNSTFCGCCIKIL